MDVGDYFRVAYRLVGDLQHEWKIAPEAPPRGSGWSARCFANRLFVLWGLYVWNRARVDDARFDGAEPHQRQWWISVHGYSNAQRVSAERRCSGLSLEQHVCGNGAN